MHSQPGIKQETKAGSSGEQAAVSIPIKIREGLEVIAFPRVDGLYFSVREFGRKVPLQRPSSSNQQQSAQAVRACIRQTIAHLNLTTHHATKAEIRVMKQYKILGKRAPASSLLSGTDMMKLMVGFGCVDDANLMREAVNKLQSSEPYASLLGYQPLESVSHVKFRLRPAHGRSRSSGGASKTSSGRARSGSRASRSSTKPEPHPVAEQKPGELPDAEALYRLAQKLRSERSSQENQEAKESNQPQPFAPTFDPLIPPHMYLQSRFGTRQHPEDYSAAAMQNLGHPTMWRQPWQGGPPSHPGTILLPGPLLHNPQIQQPYASPPDLGASLTPVLLGTSYSQFQGILPWIPNLQQQAGMQQLSYQQVPQFVPAQQLAQTQLVSYQGSTMLVPPSLPHPQPGPSRDLSDQSRKRSFAEYNSSDAESGALEDDEASSAQDQDKSRRPVRRSLRRRKRSRMGSDSRTDLGLESDGDSRQEQEQNQKPFAQSPVPGSGSRLDTLLIAAQTRNQQSGLTLSSLAHLDSQSDERSPTPTPHTSATTSPLGSPHALLIPPPSLAGGSPQVGLDLAWLHPQQHQQHQQHQQQALLSARGLESVLAFHPQLLQKPPQPQQYRPVEALPIPAAPLPAPVPSINGGHPILQTEDRKADGDSDGDQEAADEA